MALMIPKATSDISRGQPLNAEWWRFFKSVEVSLNAGGLAEQLAAIQKELAELSKPGIQPVKSVNGKYGAVILNAADVGADPVGTAAAAVAAHVAAADPHPQYTTAAEAAAAAPVQSVNTKTGAVSLSASDVGAEPTLLAGTANQVIRGDKVPSNTLTGPFYATGAGFGNTSPMTTHAREVAIYAGASGDAIGALVVAGSRTSYGGTFAVVDFYHQGSRVAAFSAAKIGTDNDSARIELVGKASGSAAVAVARFEPTNWTPGAFDNRTTCGTAPTRFKEVFAASGTINTSDAREKTEVRPLTASELAAAAELGSAVGAYQWLAMVEAKGEAARQHIGLTVQRAIEILRSHGLDPFAYGFICYDKWDELPEIRNEWEALPQVVDDFGNLVQEAREAGFEVVQEYRPAGDRYSFRMDELLAFIARGLAHRLDAVEQRLAAAGL